MGSHNETSSMMNPLEPEEFRRQAHLVVDFLADYYSNIKKYPVCSQVEPGYLTKSMPKSAPLKPEPIETILQDVQKHIIPGITYWQSPGFFGYFQTNGSTGNFLGEMLLTGFNTAGFNWLASPAATELEMIVTEWILELFQLPKSFSFSSNGGGVIHGSTCESFVCSLIPAREKKLKQLRADQRGDLCKLVVYCSDQTHFSLQKACQVVGISPKHSLLSCLKSRKLSRPVQRLLKNQFKCFSMKNSQKQSLDPMVVSLDDRITNHEYSPGGSTAHTNYAVNLEDDEEEAEFDTPPEPVRPTGRDTTKRASSSSCQTVSSNPSTTELADQLQAFTTFQKQKHEDRKKMHEEKTLRADLRALESMPPDMLDDEDREIMKKMKKKLLDKCR